MNPTDTFKALANDYRYQMLLWLKTPQQHFAAHMHCDVAHDFEGGVCVGLIAEKAGLAQSVVSGYLNTLKKAGLLESRRIGKWTYYRYHRAGVETLLQQLHEQI